jgi:hypothetical protein
MTPSEEPVVAPVAPTEPPGDAPAASPEPETTEERTYTAAELKAVRQEAQNLRKRLREAEAAAEAATPELATLRQERETLLSEVRTARLHAAIRTEVQTREEWRKLDPDLAAQLLRDVTWSDTGAPLGVKAALEAMIAKYPQLLPGPVLAPQGAATGGVSSGMTVEQTIAQKQQSGTYRRL